ncbi:MAG: class I SAM-dependent methyltransferase [Clostridia bacterium]
MNKKTKGRLVMVKGFAVQEDRYKKAKKIEKVLQNFLNSNIHSLKILDIGAGSGHIAEYFSSSNETIAVDKYNNIKVNYQGKFKYVLVENEILPFPNEYFDIILSNHVIEHIDSQSKHLEEIYRVLSKDGVCYIATPNRYYPIEPHYKLPLIHYFSDNNFMYILKILNRYKEDIHLLYYNQILDIFQKSGFKVIDYTMEVLNNYQKYDLEIGLPIKLPQFFTWISKTNIFILKKA